MTHSKWPRAAVAAGLVLALLAGCTKGGTAGGGFTGQYAPTPQPTAQQVETLAYSEDLGVRGTVASVAPSGQRMLVREREGMYVYSRAQGAATWQLTSTVDMALVRQQLGDDTATRVCTMLNGEAQDVSWAPDEGSFVFCVPGSLRYMTASGIYGCDAETGALTSLTSDDEAPATVLEGGAIDYIPVYAADGKQVYFGRYAQGEVGLMRVPAGGGKAEMVVEMGSGDWISSLYVFGGTVYYGLNPSRLADVHAVYAVQPGSRPTLLYQSPEESPYQFGIVGMTATGELAVVLNGEAYANPSSFCLIDIEEGGHRFPVEEGVRVNNAAVSPCGYKVMVALVPSPRQGELHVLDLQNGDDITVYETPDPVLSPRMGPLHMHSTLQWLADDRLVLFTGTSLQLVQLAATL